MKLNVGAFAVAFGLWWGVGLFIATWWLIATGGVTGEPTIIEQFYLGYSFTPVGSFIGLAWGVVCGAVCGGILAGATAFSRDLLGSTAIVNSQSGRHITY